MRSFSLWIGAGIFAIAAGVALAQGVSRGQKHIIKATNRLIQLVNKSPVPNPETIGKIANIGCKTLGRALDNKQFIASILKLDSLRKENRKAHDRLINDLKAFYYEFLVIEREAWLRAGLSRRSVSRLYREAAGLRWRLDKIDVSADAVIGHLKRSRATACALAKVAHQVRSKKEEIRQRQRTAIRIIYVVGGVAIIVVDASLSLAVPVSAASLALGHMVASGPFIVPPK